MNKEIAKSMILSGTAILVKCMGYLCVRISSDEVVLVHRTIIENAIGRELTKDEIVHHIDGNKLNNELNNLVVLSRSDHVKLHSNINAKLIKEENIYFGKVIIDENYINYDNITTIFKKYYIKIENEDGTFGIKKKEKKHKKYVYKKKTSIDEVSKTRKLFTKIAYCKICGKIFKANPSSKNIYCSQKCSHEDQKKTNWPSTEQLIEDIKNLPIIKIGKKYGVSDNAIRKWCKTLNIDYKSIQEEVKNKKLN